METIPLIFGLHLSIEQKQELQCIIAELSTGLSYYQELCAENVKLNQVSFLSIIDDLSLTVHNSTIHSYKFASYNLKISLLKMAYILSVSEKMVSTSSALIDALLVSSISQIQTILIDCHNLYLESVR